MRKKGILIAAILLGIVLYGCGTSGESEVEVAVSVEQEAQEDKGSRQSGKEAESLEETQAEEESLAAVSLWSEDEYAATVLEDENALYFVGEDHIRKIDKKSGEEAFIWESPEGRKVDQKWVYDSARGILVNDRIYFIESWESQEKDTEAAANYALSVVCTDGTGYERIKKVQMNLDEVLILLDGVLYYEEVRNSYSLNGYAVDQNGNLIMEEEVVAKVENVPDGYVLPYYYENGYRTMSAVESKSRFGYYLLRDENYHLCKIDPETGKKEKMPDYFEGYSLNGINEKFLLFVSYLEEQMYLYELKTGAVRSLGAFDSGSAIIAMDEEYLYLQRTVYGDDFTQHHYEQVCLKNGNVTDLFEIDKITGLNIDNPQALMDITILNGYLYYPGVQDYKLFVMRRAVEMPNAEEVLGSAFYDSKISEIGSVKTYKENMYSQNNPEWITASVDLEWLVIDGRFPGAARINKILEKEQQLNIAYENENAAYQDELYIEYGEEYSLSAFSLDSNISPIYYWDGMYLSFVQQSYDYSGGAHGMPYWNGYVFNLHTGEQLGLSDIVSDDEIQIKGLVTQYFTEMYNKDPDMYWDDAVDTVFEYTTLDSQFYLTEEGIVFYFGPYELASYAAGFQEIVVPYSAWNMKIELEE